MPRYRITQNMFLGTFVEASPRHPAVVELPEGTKENPFVKLLDDGEEPKATTPAPAHAGTAGGQLTGAEKFAAPVAAVAPVPAVEEPKKAGGRKDRSI